VREIEILYVSVCVREREREREIKCVCVCEGILQKSNQFRSAFLSKLLGYAVWWNIKLELDKPNIFIMLQIFLSPSQH